MIQLHALTDAPIATADLPRVDDRPLSDLPCGALHALVSEHDHPPSATGARLLHHADVVEALSRRMPTLPVRFGTVHRDADGLREAIATRETELLAAFERVGRHDEFVIRPVDAPVADPTHADEVDPGAVATPGRAYLERRLAEDRADATARDRIDRRLDEVAAALAGRCTAVLDRDGRHGPERCFLVPRDETDGFVTAAAEATAGTDGLIVGGPWPPFTFARRIDP